MNLGTTAPAADVLDRDLPCDACGYNLRGLSYSRRCPECSAPVARTLAADERRRLSRSFPPSPWFAREVVEGAVAGLCALMLTCGAGFAPYRWLGLHTPGRTVMMSLFTVVWVLTLVSAWKLTRSDLPPRWSSRVWPIITRAFAVTWFMGPFWFAYAVMGLPERGPAIQSLPLLSFALRGVALALLLPLRVGQLFGGVRRYLAMFIAFLVAAAAPFLAFALIPGRGFGPSSLDFLIEAPLPPYGSAALWLEAFRSLSGRWNEWVVLIGAVECAYVALLMRLIHAYVPLMRREGGTESGRQAG